VPVFGIDKLRILFKRMHQYLDLIDASDHKYHQIPDVEIPQPPQPFKLSTARRHAQFVDFTTNRLCNHHYHLVKYE
jgi:hypothetical protein